MNYFQPMVLLKSQLDSSKTPEYWWLIRKPSLSWLVYYWRHYEKKRPDSFFNFLFGQERIGRLFTWQLKNRWLLRFEFQLPHQMLSPALATDKKWPFRQFHISYQNLEISWPKALISDFQSQFSVSKIIRIYFHWRISL